MYYKHVLNLILQLKLLTFSLYIHCYWGKCSKCPLHVSQLVFKMEGYFHQKIKVVLMDVIGSKCVWKSRCDWSTHSVISWESYLIFTCELVWKISGLNLVWNFSYMKFFIHEIGVNFLSGMFNLVPHVKFLICIHFKHVSGVNQVWNRPDLMRIFCTGSFWNRKQHHLALEKRQYSCRVCCTLEISKEGANLTCHLFSLTSLWVLGQSFVLYFRNKLEELRASA